MTAEVAILNRSAVALAADSAVTVQLPGPPKIYHTNKLFTLSKYEPVGIMIYGNAELMAVPWDVAIKMYRRELGHKAFARLGGYAEDFFSFLEKHRLLFPAENQRFRFRIAISKWLIHLRHEIDRAIENRIKPDAKVSDREVATLVASIVSKHHELLQKRPNLARFDYPNGAAALQRVYGKAIEESIRDILENLPTDRCKRKLRQCCGFVGAKDAYWLEESGVVFAGFGGREIFPSVQCFRVDAVVDNKLRFALVPDRSGGITFETSSLVIAFAQSEMVRLFMNGIDSDYRNHILRFTNSVLSDRYPDIVKTAVAKALSDADAAALRENMKQVGEKLVEILTKAMRDYESEKHSDPIVEIVQHLPKEELAVMPESLVNLTSLKRHITRDAETVGGPIDVAVISPAVTDSSGLSVNTTSTRN